MISKNQVAMTDHQHQHQHQHQHGASTTTAAPQSILSDKVNRALQVRTDTPAMKAALEALGGGANLVDPRTVRHCMEDDALQQALQLQLQLEALVTSVRSLKQGAIQTADLCRTVQTATRQAVLTDAETPLTLAHNVSPEEEAKTADPTTTMATEDALAQEQQLASTLAAAFDKRIAAHEHLASVELVLEQLDPSPEDARLIQHYQFDDIDITTGHSVNGIAFLAALERMSKQLRAAHAVPGALGYLDALHEQQEQAYERTYHWIQAYLQQQSSSQQQQQQNSQLNTAADDDSSGTLETELVQTTLRLLQTYVPAFGQHILELVAQERRTWATKRFLLALTQGIQGRPPLEVRAHDAVAYAGDMLAHVFQTVSSLADLCYSLLSNNSNSTAENTAGDESNDDENTDDAILVEDPDRMTPASMMSICTGGLARPLKSRVLQVVSSLAQRSPDQGDDDDDDDEESDDDVDLESLGLQTRLERLYDICGLLLFYRSALLKMDTLQPTSAVVQAVTDCLTQATAGLEATLRVYAATLDPNAAAEVVCGLWQSLAELRTTSPGLATSDAVAHTADATDALLSPTSHTMRVLSLEWIAETLLAAALPHATNLTDIGFLQKGLQACKVAGLQIAVAEQLDQTIDGLQTQLVDRVVDDETQRILDVVGLGSIAAALELFDGSDALMSTVPGLLPHEIEAGLTQFTASLYAPPLPKLDDIQDTMVRRSSRQRIGQGVTNIYRTLYERILADDGYSPQIQLQHTPEQVETLFSA